MALKSKNSPSFSLSVSKFGGIDRTAAAGAINAAYDIRNFRILPDGSLEKRCGYRKAGELPQNIRCAWSGMLRGQPRMYLLAGSLVYSFDPSSGDYTEVGQSNSLSGPATFFMLEGRLYLKDSGGLYSIDESGVNPARGYIPLYGLDWSPSSGGEVYEPINQLSEYIRIRYKVTSTSASTVYTGFEVLEVVQVRISGNVYTTGFFINNGQKTITLPATAYSGNIVEICIRIGPSFAEREMLDSCTGAAVYGGNYDTCVYCFSGIDRARVFRSRYVRKEDVLLAQSYVPESGELYFPVGDDYYVASGGAEVSAICRHYDRLLIFGLDDARMTDLKSNVYQDTPAMPINTGVGCLNADGVAVCENDPVTISRDGIYRWTANTDERDESSAQLISGPLGSLMDAKYRNNAFIFNYRERGEMWIGNAQDSTGRVFVYNYRLKCWYCFTNIFAERFFTYLGEVGFCRGGEVFLFDDCMRDDCGEEIEAAYESGYAKLDNSGTINRIKRCIISGAGGGKVRVEFTDSNDISNSALLNCGKEDAPGLDEARCPTGRFSHLRCGIYAPGAERQRVLSLTINGSA